MKACSDVRVFFTLGRKMSPALILSGSRMRLAWLTVSIFLLAAVPTPVSSPAQPDSPSRRGVWLFSYFRQRYDSRVEIDAHGHPYNVLLPDPMHVEQLHLALSTDGRHWNPLNDGRPVWEQRLRDPFLQRGPDGVWRLVATGRDSSRTIATDDPDAGPVCLCATSRDSTGGNSRPPSPKAPASCRTPCAPAAGCYSTTTA